MKVLLGVVFCFYVASAAVYVGNNEDIFKGAPVTKFNLPGFVKKNYTDAELRDCMERKGQLVNGKFVGPQPNYNILEILKSLGGAPGEVAAQRKTNVPEAIVKNPNKRPLDDAPEDNWLYDYRITDYEFYFRLEHAVKRFAGTGKEFLDVRGELAWTPVDTCGVMRKANYRKDDTGFSSEVLVTDYCTFSGKQYSCSTIASCSEKDGNLECIAHGQ